ncbi:MAG: PhnD/SsuA/transferrin family substrate-binding protein [Burkholderiales bacterium]|nr:PhnD/SsuA/transferrin family substrate-binding protein [Burkholderiales bacterium]
MVLNRRTTVRGGIRRACALDLAALAVTSIAVLGMVPALAQSLAAATPEVAAGTVFDVKAGDSFGKIAARVTGNVAQWRTLYHPQKSGLSNPNLVLVGSQFELVKEPDGSSYLRLRSAGAARAPAPAVAAAQVAAKPAPAAPAGVPASAPTPASMPASLTLGVLPNIPVPALMAQNEPLKVYLEKSNGNKVAIVTAPNFRAFFESTMKGEYDLAVIAANLGRVAQLDGGMVPIAIYEPRIRALLIGAKDQGIKSAKDLKGKAMVFQNPQSLVALYARQWLQKQDLQPERDFEVKAVRTDVGAGRMILAGEAAGAIMSNGEFRQIPAADAERLVIVEQFAEIPNFVVLAHPRLGAGVIQSLRGQFHGFVANPVEGAAFSKATGVVRIVDADAKQMAELDAFLDQTRRAMGLIK